MVWLVHPGYLQLYDIPAETHGAGWVTCAQAELYDVP